MNKKTRVMALILVGIMVLSFIAQFFLPYL